MKIRPLILPTSKDLKLIQQKWEPVISEWISDWFSTAPDLTLSSVATSVESLLELESSQFYKATIGSGKSCVVSVPQSAVPGLLSYVVPVQITGDEMLKSHLLPELQAEVWQDLMSKVLGADFVEIGSDVFLSSLQTIGIGQPFIRIKVSIGGFYFFLSLPVDESGLSNVEIESRSEALNGRSASLKNQRVCLDIKLASTELVLSELGQIREGDVIRLDHALRTPLYVSTESSEVQLRGFLCRKGEALSIKVDSVTESVVS